VTEKCDIFWTYLFGWLISHNLSTSSLQIPIIIFRIQLKRL